MNAAARLVHQRVLTHRFSLGLHLKRSHLMFLILTFLILISALGLIYTTHVSRLLHGYFQQQLSEQNHLQVMRGQYLLERSTIMAQAQTQAFAETKLHMIVPDFKSIVVVHES